VATGEQICGVVRSGCRQIYPIGKMTSTAGEASATLLPDGDVLSQVAKRVITNPWHRLRSSVPRRFYFSRRVHALCSRIHTATLLKTDAFLSRGSYAGSVSASAGLYIQRPALH